MVCYFNNFFLFHLVTVKFKEPLTGFENDQYFILGHIEISYKNMWGTICDDYFTNSGARVLCRMMQFTGGDFRSTYRQQGVIPSDRIWLDDVKCTGLESDIDQCPHRGWGNHNCDHYEDVAIRCFGM